MRLSLHARDLVVASWPADPDAIRRAVPPGLEPAEVDGAHVVSLVGIRFAGGRAGSLPVPPFSQLNVRTYVRSEEGDAVFFLRSYVTPGGLPGVLLGAPFRAARIRVRPDRMDAAGAGVQLRFELRGDAEPGELGEHELGLFEAAGLREFRVRRGPAEWRAAELAGEPRADVLLAHGFGLDGTPKLFYSSSASFELDVPPRKASGPSSSASRSRR